MDSDMARAHGQHYDQDPLHPVEGGVEEEVPEKKSMFKRMKAKARKVKDSIGSKMHGSSSDHSQVGEEESDDDEDVVKQSKDPSPVYDSEPRNFGIGQEGKPKGPLAEYLDQNVCPGTFQTKVTDPDHKDPPIYDSEPRNFGIGQEGNPKGPLAEDLDQNVCPGTFQTKVTDPVHKDPPTAVPPMFGAKDDASEPKDSLGEEYPSVSKHQPREDSPPSYETSVNEPKPVGSEEAKDDPISSSFAKMGIHGDQQREPETPSLKSGGHDQVESSPIPDFLSDKANTIPENTEAVPPVPESFSPKTENRPQDKDVDISYPKDVDVDAHHPQDPKDVDVDAHHPQDMDVDTVDTPAPATNQGGYISSAASAVASKFGYGGNKDNSSDVPSAGVPVASIDDAVTDRSPVETPQQQGGYISSITGTAVSAKNAVTSKLGYGGSDNTDDVKSPREVTGAPISATDDVVTERSPTSTPQPQGGYISSATSALAGTAMSAKNAVASKLGYGGSDSTATTETSRGLDDTSAPTETESGKGVKRYISEKLKPGEDDKALSDYLFGASPKPKGGDEEEKAGVGQTVSDAFHKRNDEDEGRDLDKPMGKVTESDQVADRLGSSESERTGVSSPGAESPGTGMVGKFKGAFTNWFGKAEETNPSPHSPVQGTTEEHGLKKESGENASYEEGRKN